MKCIVLGSGTLVPTKRRAAPGYALFVEGQWLLIDTGAGTLVRLASAEIDYRDISAIFYTHWHPDHTGDLESFLFALNNTPGFVRNRELQIVAPPGFSAFLEGLRKVYPWISPTTYLCRVLEVSDDDFPFQVVTVQSRLVEHSSKIPSVGYRFSCGDGTLVFSGDTKFCDALVRLAMNADVLVIEASVPLEEHNPGNHLTAEQAGKIARLAHAKNVVLTHFYPVCENYDMRVLCAKEFDGNIILAEDLMELSLSTKGGLVVRQGA